MRRPPTTTAAATSSPGGLAALARPGRRLILGTASPARRAVLDDLAAKHGGFAFSVLTADLDEKALGLTARAAGDARSLVVELAVAKAEALADRLDAEAAASTSSSAAQQRALLITADQVVTNDEGVIREKPGSTAEAAAWLREYRTHPPSTVSGLCVTAWPSRQRASGVHIATVVFKDGGVPDGVLLEAAAAAAAGCAGGLRVEGPASPFVADLMGGRDSVFGLPVGLLLELAGEVGG